jgi:autotransporter-associated beta strand protein
MLGAIDVKAASGTWTNDFDSVWSDPTNWMDFVADGAGNTATFSNALSSAVQVNLDSVKTIGNLFFVQGAFTITNGGNDANILTLQGPSKPIINVPSGQSQTIRRAILAGTGGFVLDGGGTLNLFKDVSDPDPSNTITGGVVFSNATVLQVQGINPPGGADDEANNFAVGSMDSFTFYNGTLNIQPAPNTSPQYGVVNGNLIVPSGGVGTIVLPVRFTGAAGDNSTTPGNGLGGTLTGSGTLNVTTRYVRGNVVGDWSAFSGQINLTPGSTSAIDQDFRPGQPSAFPLAGVDLGGSTYMTFRYYRQITNSAFYPIGLLTGANTAAFFVGSATPGATLILRTGARQNPGDTGTLAASLTDGAGPLAIVKEGPGTWIITGANTYSGFTTISNGVLQVGDGGAGIGALGTGPVTNLSSLVFAAAGTLNVTAPISGTGSLSNTASGPVILLGTNTYSGPTVVSAGELAVGMVSAATGGYTVGDNSTLTVRRLFAGGTMTVSSMSFGNTCNYNFNLASFGNPSATVVSNTGAITTVGNVTVNIAATNLTVGQITLLRYGSRIGVGSFVLGTVPATVTAANLIDDTINKQVVLNITGVVIPPDTTLKYVGDAIGNWDIGNTANKIWKETFSSIITNYYDGAAVRFDDSATGTTTINVTAVVSPGGMTVSNNLLTYTFPAASAISGVNGLTKQGTGKLTLNTLGTGNDYTGPTDLENGTLEITNLAGASPIFAGGITNNSTLLLNNTNSDISISGIIRGSGIVIQKGSDTVTLTGANTHTGGVLVEGGVLALNNGTAAGNGGSIVISNAVLSPGAADIPAANTIIVLNQGVIGTNGANRQIDAPIRGTNATLMFSKSGTALITLNGDLNGFFGTITNDNTGLLRFNSGGGNTCLGSSNTLFVFNDGSSLQNRNGGVIDLGAITGSGLLGSPQNANNNTVNWRIGGLNTSTLYWGTINDNNTNSNNRLTSISKIGTGTLTLSNALLSYFGPTSISNGVVALVGTPTGLSNSTPIQVSSPGVLDVTGLPGGTLYLGQVGTIQTNRVQSLQGTGNIQGNVTIGALGRLEPGFSIGTLTVSGTATLGGTNVMQFSTTNTPTTSDRLVAGNIIYGGTLIITNIGSNVITGTTTLQLFSGALSGSFTTVITQAIAGVSYDLSQLNSAGIVKVTGAASVNTNPTNITFQASGGQMTVSWPQDHTGWRLQSQTNTLAVGLKDTSATNWTDVTGSTATNSMSFPIGTTNGAVFFQLIYP